MGGVAYLDTILVPLSVFLIVGYHAYLWHIFKNKPSLTTFGINTLRRRVWFQGIKQGDDRKGVLAVQTLRNTQMGTILNASIVIVINLSLAALTNNSYNANHLLKSAFFGSQSGRIFAVKYGSASLFLSVSFLCSSMAIVHLIDASFMINAPSEFLSPAYAQMIFERGFMLAVVGSRVLYITFPLLLWMFGPVAVALSSVALIWCMYKLDFGGNTRSNNQILT